MELPPVLISALRESIQTVVLTGSGISAESGVPTFREAQTGLWARFDPQELATPEAFARDPGLVWNWYAWRRKLVAEARPNPGHFAIAEMQRLVPNLTLVTQNVDGLHRRAGSSDVIELHGNISRTTCSVEGTRVESYNEVRSPPPCPSCGAPLRPDVVWFGEELPVGSLEEASEAARGADLFLPVGTSSLVYPAAALPFEALEGGATLVEVNPADTCSRRMRTMRCADRRAMFCRVRSGNFRSSPFYVRRVGSSYSSDVREREEHCLCRWKICARAR